MGSRRNANKPGGSVSDLSMEDIKEALLPGIRSAIKADMEEVIKSTLGDRLDRIEARLGDLTQLQQVVTDLRKATADTSERMDDLLKVTIPALTRHFEDVTSALVMRQLDQDMHRRKWSLTIQGLPGDAKEDEGDTRRTCVEFAKKTSKSRWCVRTGLCGLSSPKPKEWCRHHRAVRWSAAAWPMAARRPWPQEIPFSVFLDLSKAFDTLNHHILLSKLEYYGIKNIAFQWFKSYLTQRQQFVEYQEVCSSTRELETGVPQGSVLGPLLFLIYMNDIHTVSDKLNFILYADDTTLTSPLCSFTHGAHNDVSHISSQINSELLKISDWLTVNKLSLNVEKTKFMVFHNYQRVIANEDIPDLMINDKKIDRVSCCNFLGLTINEFMNWSSHSAKFLVHWE